MFGVVVFPHVLSPHLLSGTGKPHILVEGVGCRRV